ncbi:MAG TPA: hypothetical protein VIU61_27250 [Kofleriaceae bacterium]
MLQLPQIGRAAIDHPWIFREASALLAGGTVAPPSDAERLAMYAAIATGNVERRGLSAGLGVSRRHLGVLGPLLPDLRRAICMATTLEATLSVLAPAMELASSAVA